MTDVLANRPTTVVDYVAILRRRKWILIGLPVVAGIAAYMFSQGQPSVYQATAEVLVKRSSIVTAITNVQDPAIGDPQRYLATRASIARAPELANRVVAAAGVAGISAGTLLGELSVQPASDADLLDISVSDPNPADAVILANTYARELTLYNTELETSAINQTLELLNTRIAALAARGQTGSVSYATLVQYQGELETIGKLLANNTKVLQPAGGAAKVSPRPKRNGIMGALLGAVLGIGFAFLGEALDRRMRSEGEIERVLGLPLLARLPKPPRRLRKAGDLVMLADPKSVQAETFRKLRASIEFVNIDRHARTIMVTSAVQLEGKSTTVANLAVALARAGRRVVLVDLDLRRPILSRFFHARSSPGLTDVAVGRATLADAVRPIALTPTALPGRPASGRGGANAGATNGKPQLDAVLHLLPAGTLPPSPSEFLEDERISTALEELAEQFDFVLVDGPPLLAFSDALSLSAKVDAIFVVTRLNVVQRPALQELARQLESCRAPALGFVLTGVGRGDAYRYGYEGYGYDLRPAPQRAEQRM